MDFAIITVAVLLICIGICAIIEQIKRLFFEQPTPSVIKLHRLNAENAEFRLRSAIFSARGKNCIIHAVCEDDEAYRICQMLSDDSGGCIVCSKKFQK